METEKCVYRVGAAADGVEELLRRDAGSQLHAVVQLVERAHAGRADLIERICVQILREQVVEQAVIVEVFGDGDLEHALARASSVGTP